MKLNEPNLFNIFVKQWLHKLDRENAVNTLISHIGTFLYALATL
jgi:hypothetical protein